MEIAYQTFSKGDTFPIDEFSIKFTAEKIANIHHFFSQQTWENYFTKTLKNMETYMPSMLNSDHINLKESIYEPLQLTPYQYEEIQNIFDELYNSKDEDDFILYYKQRKRNNK